MEKARDLRVAVVGAGLMGTVHARLLSTRVRGATVTVVSDPGPGRAEAVAAELGARAELDPLAAIAAPDVDAVVLASPGPVHEAQVMACLERRLPVLCEKPLTVDAAGALRIVKSEEALGARLVQVGFMRRFDPEHRQLKELITSGELGPPLLLHLVHRNVGGPDGYTSALAITESVVHEVDIIRYLLAEEVRAVSVHCGVPTSRADAGVADPMLVLFETASGRLADVEIFIRTGVAYEVRAELVAENGTARTGMGARALKSGPGPRWGAALDTTFSERFALAYEDELQGWVDAAREGTVAEDGAGAWDGYAAQVVCEAGAQALETGARVEVALAPQAPTPHHRPPGRQ
jgi:myo-inositol 2-dehydrogenase/D-chiro-inositol 1-dehydrogenase